MLFSFGWLESGALQHHMSQPPILSLCCRNSLSGESRNLPWLPLPERSLVTLSVLRLTLHSQKGHFIGVPFIAEILRTWKFSQKSVSRQPTSYLVGTLPHKVQCGAVQGQNQTLAQSVTANLVWSSFPFTSVNVVISFPHSFFKNSFSS